MDFETRYTEVQEKFRQEVRVWLEENIPEAMKKGVRVDPNNQEVDINLDGTLGLTDEQYRFWRDKHQELAKKKWLHPTYPEQYGGGGLSGDHETILEEEFMKAQAPRSGGASFLLPALLVWATEEQKQKFLRPLLMAEKVAIQAFTEPNAGSDLASLQSRAVRDGDDWIISGQKVFIGNPPDGDWLYGPIITDPEAPRHRNLGFFLIPVKTSGIEFRAQHLLGGASHQHFLFMDNVSVPGDHLIGGDHQGWQVTNTSLEQEHGGRGQAFPRDEAMDNLLTYVRETQREGSSLGKNPVVQQKTMDSYIASNTNTLFAKRNFWMYQARQEMSYHGSQATMWSKDFGVHNADRARSVMKMTALLGIREPGVAFGGQMEMHQRGSLIWVHPGGTLDVQKVIVARRIGISRTKERAAPTPATATQHGS